MTVWMQWHRTDGFVTGMSVFITEPEEWTLQLTMDGALAWLEALDEYGPEIISRLAQ